MNPMKMIREYKFYAKTGKGFASGFELFNVEECEICAKEILGVNGVQVSGITRGMLFKAGLKERAKPFDEGGYSEMHGLSTCTECCYDEDAIKKHAKLDETTPCNMQAIIEASL